VEKTAAGNAEGQKITFNVIKARLGDVLYKLTAQKFEDPGKCPMAERGVCSSVGVGGCGASVCNVRANSVLCTMFNMSQSG
jgi:hypothetical protein